MHKVLNSNNTTVYTNTHTKGVFVDKKIGSGCHTWPKSLTISDNLDKYILKRQIIS